MADSFIPDTRFSQVCRGIIAHAQERLAVGDLFESNVEPTSRREETFSRLLLQYEKSGRIVLDDRAVTDIHEAYGMSEHNLQIVEGEVLATRLGWDESRDTSLNLNVTRGKFFTQFRTVRLPLRSSSTARAPATSRASYASGARTLYRLFV
jgi:hypothetical protein